jgi:hypothetical protein
MRVIAGWRRLDYNQNRPVGLLCVRRFPQKGKHYVDTRDRLSGSMTRGMTGNRGIPVVSQGEQRRHEP